MIRLSTERVFCVIRIVGFAEGMRAVYTKGMVGGEENAVQLPRGADVLANNNEGKRETREEDVLRLVKWSSLFKKECLRGRTVRFPILIYYFTTKRDSI